MIGEGFHAELGGLHAERAALADCRERGEDPAGATMYVTLEPCAHQGRQPPCVEAILEAGIARVVIASEDPSEKAAGRGPGILRDGGVEVDLRGRRRGRRGAAAQPALPQARPHRAAAGHSEAGDVARRPDNDRPRRLALDLRRAQPRPGPPLARRIRRDRGRHRHRPRRRPPAHRPSPPDARQPLRVVFDSRARLPLDSQLLATLDQSPVLVVTSPDADPSRVSALRDAGAEILVASGAAPADRIASALADLGRRDITSLFLEGGRTLAAAFAAAGQVDESRTFVAPMLLGSSPNRPGPRPRCA